MPVGSNREAPITFSTDPITGEFLETSINEKGPRTLAGGEPKSNKGKIMINSIPDQSQSKKPKKQQPPPPWDDEERGGWTDVFSKKERYGHAIFDAYQLGDKQTGNPKITDSYRRAHDIRDLSIKFSIGMAEVMSTRAPNGAGGIFFLLSDGSGKAMAFAMEFELKSFAAFRERIYQQCYGVISPRYYKQWPDIARKIKELVAGRLIPYEAMEAWGKGIIKEIYQDLHTLSPWERIELIGELRKFEIRRLENLAKNRTGIWEVK